MLRDETMLLSGSQTLVVIISILRPSHAGVSVPQGAAKIESNPSNFTTYVSPTVSQSTLVKAVYGT